MRETGAENRIDLLMRTSNDAQLVAAGVTDRHKGDRRFYDHLQAGAIDLSLVAYK